MKGFFEKEIPKTPYKSAKGIYSCVSCGRYKDAISPKMEPYGNFKQGIMILGEAPDEADDKRSKPWRGKSGRLLQQTCRKLGIDLFEDCVSLNAISCRPTDKNGDRPPTDYEIACCHQKVVSAIQKYKPKVIVMLGGSTLTSLIGPKWTHGTIGGIMKWRGWAIPDREYQAWLCPTFHPSFVEKQEQSSEVEVIWEQDLKRAFAKTNDSFPTYKDESQEVILVKPGEITATLRNLNTLIPYENQRKPRLAFDIETTGLKPYNKDIHKIVCISFCCSSDKVYSMPAPTEEVDIELMKRLLENPNIGKIAANMKFEDTWMNIMYGIQPRPWVFDTMQAAHVLDNRPGITGLKFQAFVNFGASPDYDDGVTPYLKSPNANTPNRIIELIRDRESFKNLLTYCGLDALHTYRLAKKQMGLLDIK
jgi:uracil-DNA glycosylase family 4